MLFATENNSLKRVPFANNTNLYSCNDGKRMNAMSMKKPLTATMGLERKLVVTKSGRKAHMLTHTLKSKRPTKLGQHMLPVNISDISDSVIEWDATKGMGSGNDSHIGKRTGEEIVHHNNNDRSVAMKMKLIVNKENVRNMILEHRVNGFEHDLEIKRAIKLKQNGTVPLNGKINAAFDDNIFVDVERLKQQTLLKYMKVPFINITRMILPLTEETESRGIITNSCEPSNCLRGEVRPVGTTKFNQSVVKFNGSAIPLNEKVQEGSSKNVPEILQHMTQLSELKYAEMPFKNISVSNETVQWLNDCKLKSISPKVIIENNKVIDDLSSDCIDKLNSILLSDSRTDNIIPTFRQPSPNIKILRKRKTRDYAEISLVQSPSPKKNKRNVPVYRLKSDEEPKKIPDDLYDFDSDSEKPKLKRRKKKLCTSNNKSVAFEKDMNKIMQKIEKKFKSKSRNVGKKTINKRVVISNKKPDEFPKVSSLIDCQYKVAIPKRTNDSNVLTALSNTAENVKETISNQNFRYNENLSKHLTNVLTNKLMDEEIEIQAKRTANKTLENDDYDDHDDNMFGFDDDISDSEGPINNKENRINIISNVIICARNTNDRNIAADKLNVNYRSFNRPDANSTMITQSIPASPWRPNLGTPRNPHFLHIKDTFLPNYNQEMVIDWCLLEKTLPAAHTPDKSETPRRSHQTSMLDFISKSATKTFENERRLSLFDCEDFSPIKSKAQDKSLLELQILSNNSSPAKRLPNKIPDTVKRNILGPKIDNLSNIQVNNVTPLEKTYNKILSEDSSGVNSDIENYFGFDSFCDENEPPQCIKRNYKKPIQPNKPIRFVCFPNDVKEKIGSDHSEENAQEIMNESEIPTENIENCELNVGLFEDLESIPKRDPPRRYERRHLRQRKQVPVLSDDSDVEDKPKRKKKNALTKKEQMEADKWAAAFNSMCEEVEEYSLEIE